MGWALLREGSPSQKSCIALGSASAGSGDGVAVSLAFPLSLPVGVSTEPVLHAGRQVRLGSSQEKVDVIWHPAIGDLVPRGALHFVSQTVCEPSLVTVVMKDGPATITARDDVVHRTGELQTRRSGHRSRSFRVERRTNVGCSIRLKTENQVGPL